MKTINVENYQSENKKQCDSFSLVKSQLSSQFINLTLQNTDKCVISSVIYSHLNSLILHFAIYFSEDKEAQLDKKSFCLQCTAKGLHFWKPDNSSIFHLTSLWKAYTVLISIAIPWNVTAYLEVLGKYF